jgi:magnesium transporter
MNFRFMPELDEVWGYPVALGLIVVAGLLPWLFFKRRGWL